VNPIHEDKSNYHDDVVDDYDDDDDDDDDLVALEQKGISKKRLARLKRTYESQFGKASHHFRLFASCVTVEQLNLVMYYFGRRYRNSMRRFVCALFRSLSAQIQIARYFETVDPVSFFTPRAKLLLFYFDNYINDENAPEILFHTNRLDRPELIRLVLSYPKFQTASVREKAIELIIRSNEDTLKDRKHSNALRMMMDYPDFGLEKIMRNHPFKKQTDRFGGMLRQLDTNVSAATEPLDVGGNRLIDLAVPSRVASMLMFEDYNKCCFYRDRYLGPSAFVRFLIERRMFTILDHHLPEIARLWNEKY